jgi:pimeloyl-ACP methyl ester carboxylesterase
MTQLLLLHGALGSSSQFEKIRPLLIEKGLATDAINFSGHGGFSMPVSGYNFNVFADDILRYANEHKIEKLNLFGYSMGGYAALYFAKMHPGRVHKIAAINVKFNWDPLSTQKEIALLNAEKMAEKIPSFVDKLMVQHGMNFWKQVIHQTATLFEQMSKDYILTKEDYEKLTMPILLGVGDKDTTTSIEETLTIFRELPNAAFWVLPNTPHPFDNIDSRLLTEQLSLFFDVKETN